MNTQHIAVTTEWKSEPREFDESRPIIRPAKITCTLTFEFLVNGRRSLVKKSRIYFDENELDINEAWLLEKIHSGERSVMDTDIYMNDPFNPALPFTFSIDDSSGVLKWLKIDPKRMIEVG